MSAAFQKEVIRQLQKAGSDITKPHDFEFFLRLPTESIAETVADKIRRSGFDSAEVSQPVSGDGWTCVAKKSLVPGTANLADHARFFLQLAAAGGGEFDGWEAEVV